MSNIAWENIDPLLGFMFDKDLAFSSGVSRAAITHRRKKKGIAPYSAVRESYCRRRFPTKYDKLLGTLPDSKLAVMLEQPPFVVSSVRRELGIPRYRVRTDPLMKCAHLIGTMPDNTLAKKYNTSRDVITNERMRLGIPAYYVKKEPNPELIRDPEAFWEVWDTLLGEVPDKSIAQVAKISNTTVGRRRKLLGIPPCSRRKKGQ